ncbi:uncharacterized protein LOC128673964 [Plodia interpunctella]|uniref:uncharacterized protein LOC128673964 n=1 Tax=Plodia interpunctella TaxID=58824 RepID=UPI002367C458|nr:uncharacterized protein LOC128673964 [Plodia interpunctella]
MCKLNVCYFITLILIINLADATKNCNRVEELKKCSRSPDTPIALTQEELNKSCVDLHTSIDCIENYIQVCLEKYEQIIVRRIQSGVTEVVHDLCTRGSYQDEYLRHASCIKSVRAEYGTCSKTYEDTVSSFDQQQKTDQSNEDSVKTICCSYQKYLTCSEQIVQKTCGDEAAVFIKGFLNRMSSKMFTETCQQHPNQGCSSDSKVVHSNVNVTTNANLFSAKLHVLI